MTSTVAVLKGKLETIYFHRRHRTSTCWNCAGVTDLATRSAIAWEFYCPTCEVTWHEPV